MSELGQSRHFDGAPITSGLPREADIFRVRRYVSKVPTTDSCAAANASLFNHHVGARKQRRRYGEAERPGGLEIDHELEFGRLLDRQIGRLVTPENLPA